LLWEVSSAEPVRDASGGDTAESADPKV